MPKLIAERDDALRGLNLKADDLAFDARTFHADITIQLEAMLKLAYARGYVNGWSNRRA